MKYPWNTITFGQSTDLSFQIGVLPQKTGLNEVRKTEHGIEIESRGGKIQPAHDGITFYYTRIPADCDFELSADLTLLQMGPETGAAPNGQEACGLMLRDCIGPARQNPPLPGFEEYPSASNLMMLEFAPSERKSDCPASLCAAVRRGVVHPAGNPGIEFFSSVLEPSAALPLLNDKPGRYHRRLHCRLVRRGQKIEFFYAFKGDFKETEEKAEKRGVFSTDETPALADILQVLDRDFIYAGFFAARNACMEVDGIVLKVEDDFKSASEFCQLGSANQDSAAAADRKSGTATNRESGTAAAMPSACLFASPAGSETGDGTRQKPLSFSQAVKNLLPGQTLFLMSGTYKPAIIEKEASGFPSLYKKIRCLGPVVFRPESPQPESAAQTLFILDSDYWDIDGLEFDGQNMDDVSGFLIHGSHNIISNCQVHHTCPSGRDAGFTITTRKPKREFWPSFNQLTNCLSFENRDNTGQNADGFSCRSGAGEGNRFTRCIAHHNCDDGFDLYTNITCGPEGAVVLDHCIAYENQANGFKLGGEGQENAHKVKNCLSFHNGLNGFSDNFNPGALLIKNNTAYDNGRSNFLFRPSPYKLDENNRPSSDCILKGNISFRTEPQNASKQKDYVAAGRQTGNWFA